MASHLAAPQAMRWLTPTISRNFRHHQTSMKTRTAVAIVRTIWPIDVAPFSVRTFSTRSSLRDDDDSNVAFSRSLRPSPTESATRAASSFPFAQRSQRPMKAREALNEVTQDAGTARYPDGHIMPDPVFIKPGVAAGRTVAVPRNPILNLPSGLKRFDRMVKTESIRTDARMQKFHERPGLKRKRLRRQRWKAHFKEGFFDLVRKAREMKRMGW